jgi:hypothetical protein
MAAGRSAHRALLEQLRPMNRGHQPEPAGYVEGAARISWDEHGSFGFDVARPTARDMTAEEHFFSDYAVVPLTDNAID